MKPATFLRVLVLFGMTGSAFGVTPGQDISVVAAATDRPLLLADARPAATGESPEAADMKLQPLPARKEDVRRPTAADLVSGCKKDPECARQLGAARSNDRSTRPLPAASVESPEEAGMKKIQPPSGGEAIQRPTAAELVSGCRQDPECAKQLGAARRTR